MRMLLIYFLPCLFLLHSIILSHSQDAAKVYTYKLLKMYNVFSYNDTGMVPNHPNHPDQIILREMRLNGVPPELLSNATSSSNYNHHNKHSHSHTLSVGGNVHHHIDVRELEHGAPSIHRTTSPNHSVAPPPIGGHYQFTTAAALGLTGSSSASHGLPAMNNANNASAAPSSPDRDVNGIGGIESANINTGLSTGTAGNLSAAGSKARKQVGGFNNSVTSSMTTNSGGILGTPNAAAGAAVKKAD